MLLLRQAAVAALALFALATAPATARAAEPIEGTWNYAGGSVLVEPSGSGAFRGTVVRATRFLKCVHPVGERMWAISGRGERYSGTHQWFTDPGCAPEPGGQATWAVREVGDRLLLDFCTAPPNQGAPTSDNEATRCSTLERTRPPAPGGVPSWRPDSDAGTGTDSRPATSSPAPSTAPVCSSGACLGGPAPIRPANCVAPGPLRHTFAFRLKPSQRKRLKVVVVRFALDWKPAGRRRRGPYRVRIDGAKLAPGAHILRADARLRDVRRKRTRHQRLTYRFRICRASEVPVVR